MSELEFLKGTSDPGSRGSQIGFESNNGAVVARGDCPFCGAKSSFRQINTVMESELVGPMVPVSCDGCKSIITIETESELLHPSPQEQGLDDLPNEIDQYYQEGLRCLSANAPNGAATVFRKVIHAVCLHYDVADVDDNSSVYSMITSLSEEGVITENLRKSLLGVKDAGNDGAHINDNDPSMEQARNLKDIIDAVLTATVQVDQRVSHLREDHPNPHQE